METLSTNHFYSTTFSEVLFSEETDRYFLGRGDQNDTHIIEKMSKKQEKCTYL